MSKKGMTILSVETAAEKRVHVWDSRTAFAGTLVGAVRLYLTTIKDQPFAAWEYGKSSESYSGYCGVGMPTSRLDKSVTFENTTLNEVFLETDFDGPFLEEPITEYDEKTGLNIVKEKLHVVHTLGQATLLLTAPHVVGDQLTTY